jgi:tRNA A37 threonylcarbamoyladenosine biosynthesis protein TsaE
MAAEQVMDTRDITENLKNSLKPNRILLFSGKRKSGKDYITEILHNRY